MTAFDAIPAVVDLRMAAMALRQKIGFQAATHLEAQIERALRDVDYAAKMPGHEPARRQERPGVA